MFRFYRSVSNSSLNKNGKLSDKNSRTPNNVDQMLELKKVRLKNPKNVIIETLNINYISGNLDKLKCLISSHADILVLTETKLDETFTSSSFLIDGFSSPFWLDRSRKGGGILRYVRGDNSSKLLTKHSIPKWQKRIICLNKC